MAVILYSTVQYCNCHICNLLCLQTVILLQTVVLHNCCVVLYCTYNTFYAAITSMTFWVLLTLIWFYFMQYLVLYRYVLLGWYNDSYGHSESTVRGERGGRRVAPLIDYQAHVLCAQLLLRRPFAQTAISQHGREVQKVRSRALFKYSSEPNKCCMDLLRKNQSSSAAFSSDLVTVWVEIYLFKVKSL